MAELTIRPEDIRDALTKHVASYNPGAAARDEIGTVTEAGDGIARVEGLPSTMTNELLKFENGTLGLALNLDVREIGVVILGEFTGIEEGTSVSRTGEILSVPVGDGFLGRVVDALGRPIDGKGDIKAEAQRALEVQAPSVVQRQPVKEPMQTGIKAIDAMTAIGRGQRQLIIGDRQTGKTAIASKLNVFMLLLVRKVQPLPLLKAHWKKLAQWNTQQSLHHLHQIQQASNIWLRTLVRLLASTGCTRASTF